tara:strand:+ start:256 stop:1419 length:1164 start_codon:yes stop_codon:yes gene_type:complete
MIVAGIKRVVLGIIILPLILTLSVLVFLDGKAVYRSALLITELLPGISLPILDILHDAPIHQALKLEVNDKIIEADLYMPDNSQKVPAFIFFLGVSPSERGSDPRVESLVNALARLGVAVMVPWLETQEKEIVVKDDIESLVYLFEYLSDMEEIDDSRIGMGGICTGASMVALAASDVRISQKVKFLTLFAGYYDAFDFMKAVTSERRFYKGSFQDWKPDSLTRKIVFKQLVESVSNDHDRGNLNQLIRNGNIEIKIDIFNTDEAKVVYSLISNPHISDVDPLFQRLPSQTVLYLEGISPSNFTQQLNAKVLIMHDRNDRLVPVEESKRFNDSLKSNGSIYYTEFSSFQNQIQVHVDKDSKKISSIDYLIEAWKLLRYLYEVMKQVS